MKERIGKGRKAGRKEGREERTKGRREVIVLDTEWKHRKEL